MNKENDMKIRKNLNIKQEVNLQLVSFLGIVNVIFVIYKASFNKIVLLYNFRKFPYKIEKILKSGLKNSV